MNKNELLNQLVDNMFKGISNNERERLVKLCKTFCQAQLQLHNAHAIISWSHKWKKQLKPETTNELDVIVKKMPSDKLQIYRLLDLLKFTKNTFVITKANPEFSRVTRKSRHFISENQLVSELILLLKGGKSSIFTIQNYQYMIDGLIMPHHINCVSKIMSNCICIDTLNSIIGKLYGIVGQSVETVLQKEKNEYITEMQSLTSEMSLLNLMAYSCGPIKQSLEAAAFIAYTILNSDEDEDIFSILKSASNHGSPAVNKVAQKCFNEAKSAYTDIVCDWVLYGRLADPYNEFFVLENEEHIRSCDWWDNQYYIEPIRIPSFVKSDTLAAQIASCGRAWNFIRYFKRIAMENGGARASLMLHAQTESLEKNFDLNLLSKYSNESMKNVLNIVKNIIWLPGHIKTITDFILLRRGDFVVSLFENFLHEGAPISLLDHVIRDICQDSVYINKRTSENTTLCIDVKMTARNEIDNSPEAVILHYNAPTDLTYILDDSIIDSYIQVGRLIWSLKCCERRLLMNWQNSRLSASSFSKIDFSDTNVLQSALRFSIITAVRSISEFFTMDVISVIQRELMIGIDQADNIDKLLSLIRMSANKLKLETFVTCNIQKFIDFQNALNILLNVVNDYNIIEEDFIGNLSELEDMLADNSADFAKLMREYREIRSEFNFNISKSKGDFQDALRDLYELTLVSPELWMLESRLQFCVAHFINK
ncbi:Spc97 / Spc98 family protein [Trichomonas vaginalis G3]|uniref:Spc97 / Spc98 family protein n=1 Tax=Trichomonas vaginalis (strain ATCC PRA-98 / G3) TaxID=412133 RepID=A2E3S1_TRIV3|nr:microtubule nucleation by interphase microtubule organizing center [Trichomonas vaginalis G3]EAY12709.1 Spc97 / Spc98 family protein [Trichomonas vaginalis G3]KAI5517529.1 microtubule nucleation by interphase microtubule organizing center [Trichomonas vaginalis G3]|eukprot:XP_001324932.1 Spc97 / Spc98 family protein [Trichomonas vaginalis G3]